MISRWKRNVGQSEKVDGETKKRSVATFAPIHQRHLPESRPKGFQSKAQLIIIQQQIRYWEQLMLGGRTGPG